MSDDNRDTKKFRCDIEGCTSRFNYKQVLDRHIVLKHSYARPFPCLICDKSFKTAGSLKEHKLSHIDEKNFGCDVCHKSFKTKKQLAAHSKFHTAQRTFVCSVCQKGFKMNQHLKKHSLICTPPISSQHSLSQQQVDALNINSFEYPAPTSLVGNTIVLEPVEFSDTRPTSAQNSLESLDTDPIAMQSHSTDPMIVSRRERPIRLTATLREKMENDRILSGSEDGLEVRMVDGKGRGIFATRLFKKDEFLAFYKSEMVREAEGLERMRRYRLEEKGNFLFKFKYNGSVYYMDATEEPTAGVASFARLMNHCHPLDNPNAKAALKVVNRKPHIIFRCTRDVHPGEEVCYDYNDHDEETYLRFPWMAALDDQAEWYAKLDAGILPATQSTQPDLVFQSQVLI